MAGKNRIDEQIAYDYALDVLNELRTRLRKAAKGSGLKLTPNECFILANHIANPVRPKGRPLNLRNQMEMIAIYSFQREAELGKVDAAVAATMTRFGVKRSTVFAARREVLSK